jgi:hypothetical protein
MKKFYASSCLLASDQKLRVSTSGSAQAPRRNRKSPHAEIHIRAHRIPDPWDNRQNKHRKTQGPEIASLSANPLIYIN